MNTEAILIETSNYRLTRNRSGVRITALERLAIPRSGVFPIKEWDNYLSTLSPDAVDAACVWDYGIGVKLKHWKRRRPLERTSN